MRTELSSFVKHATITVLTGRTGSGKTTLAEKWAPKYDKIVQTDMPRPMNDKTGEYDEPTPKDKARIRSERINEILEANKQGKKVLVEGHPPGIIKLLGPHLAEVDKTFLIPISQTESMRRIVARAEANPEERSVEIDKESATVANDKYEKYLKQLRDVLPITMLSGQERTKTAQELIQKKPSIGEKLDSHFAETDPNRWDTFKVNLKSKRFAGAVQKDPRADERLKRFSDMNSRHLTVKGKGYKMPGLSDTYRVKYHPDIDRYSCNCGDWVHKKAPASKNQPQDCKHITALKNQMDEGVGGVLKEAARRGLVARAFLS